MDCACVSLCVRVLTTGEPVVVGFSQKADCKTMGCLLKTLCDGSFPGRPRMVIQEMHGDISEEEKASRMQRVQISFFNSVCVTAPGCEHGLFLNVRLTSIDVFGVRIASLHAWSLSRRQALRQRTREKGTLRQRRPASCQTPSSTQAPSLTGTTSRTRPFFLVRGS